MATAHHHHHQHHHFLLFHSFSTASFRFKLLSAISCGATSSPQKTPPPQTHPHPHPNPNRPTIKPGRTTPLWPPNDVVEVKRKEERLEELTMAVKMVQNEKTEERENGAKLVRRLAKEDGEARSTLTMLGAIPPLVAMIGVLDVEDEGRLIGTETSQIEALYALLNLGIGNNLYVIF